MFLQITLKKKLTKLKIFIGIITELFAFVPTLFLVVVFSISKLKTKLNEKTNVEFENAKVFQKTIINIRNRKCNTFIFINSTRRICSSRLKDYSTIILIPTSSNIKWVIWVRINSSKCICITFAISNNILSQIYQITIIWNNLSSIISNNQAQKKQPQLPLTPPPESTM